MIKKKITANSIVSFICIIIYFLYSLILNYTNDDISTMILLGVDYKTFTLGLGEYFRLITSGFCHFSFFHLFFNIIALSSLGSFIENVYGTKRYIIYLICGILLGSLTSGILNTNVIESGISAALYTFFIMFVLFVFVYKQKVSSSFMPILFINLGLNFMPNVAWQAHLGGAIAGVIFFYIDYYERTKYNSLKLTLEVLLVLTIVLLFFKYYQTKSDINDYPGTDMQYVEYLDKNFKPLKEYYNEKIYNYYIEKRK